MVAETEESVGSVEAQIDRAGGVLSLGGTVNGVNVTNAPGYTYHGDFINAWDQPELERRVRDCVNAGRICGTNGNPI